MKTRLHFILITIFILSITTIINAQTFINGNFETNTSTTCSYNLNNPTFTSAMSNMYSFGSSAQGDIQTFGCYGDPQNGSWCVGVGTTSSGGYDAMGIELSSSLIVGNLYELTFWAMPNTSFNPVVDSLQIGLSTNNNSMGTIIYTVMTTGTAWQQYTVQFNPPSANISFITVTVKTDNLAINWIQIDNFSIVNTGSNSSSTISESACDSYTSPSGNYIWTASGTYMDTIPNYLGSDSVMTINLTISNSTSSSFAETVCDEYISPSGNYIWNISGTYFDTIPNTAGCDSIIEIDLIINNSTSSTITESACESYTSPSGANTWTSTGIYTDIIPNSIGCDSVITVDLTIYQTSVSTIEMIQCNSYDFNGNILTESGNYSDTLISSIGCDSIVNLNLTINSIDVTVSVSGVVLTSNENGATYQWLACDVGFAEISGETSQSFTIISGGSYAVLVTNNGCSDTSGCYYMEAIEDFYNSNLFSLYPNPTTGKITIDLGKQYSEISLRVTNIVGQSIFTEFYKMSDILVFEIDDVEGIYFVDILTNNGVSRSFKVSKY